jgi:hypothetical protein
LMPRPTGSGGTSAIETGIWQAGQTRADDGTSAPQDWQSMDNP